MDTRTSNTDIEVARHILTGLRRAAAGLSATADTAATLIPKDASGRAGVAGRAEALETAFAGLEEHTGWAAYYRLLLDAHTDPDLRIDQARLWRVMPGLALAFRGRLAERIKPVDDALAERDYQAAAWGLTGAIKKHEICLAPGEETALSRVRSYLFTEAAKEPRD